MSTFDFDPAELISLKEAAALVPGRRPGKRSHVARLYRLVHNGKLRAWKFLGALCVRRADVLALFEPVPVTAPRPRQGLPRQPAVAAWVQAELQRHGLG